MYTYILDTLTAFIGFECVPLVQFLSGMFPYVFITFCATLLNKAKTTPYKVFTIAYVMILSLAVLASNGVYLPFKIA